MTPEQRAVLIVCNYASKMRGPALDALLVAITDAIREAVEAERKACEKIIVDELDILTAEAERKNLTDFGDGCLSATKNLLAEIRRRGEG